MGLEDARWVDRLELLSIAALHELAVDIQAEWLGILAPVRSSELGEEVRRHGAYCSCV